MESNARTAVIIGVGPGLGMSMARRTGKRGYRVALISRNGERHESYLDDLAARGVEASAHAVDVADRERLGAVLDTIRAEGEVEFVYYGPAPMDMPVSITEAGVDTTRASFETVWSAVHVVNAVLPGMLARGAGGLIFAGGLSSVRPMPALGQLALVSAALRNYAVTLNAALAESGVYAGTLTIGGLVERGDIHAMVTAEPTKAAAAEGHTLDPDELAETAWRMYSARDRAETVFDILGG